MYVCMCLRGDEMKRKRGESTSKKEKKLDDFSEIYTFKGHLKISKKAVKKFNKYGICIYFLSKKNVSCDL